MKAVLAAFVMGTLVLTGCATEDERGTAEQSALTRDMETCLVRGNLSAFTSLTPKDARAEEWVLPWREPVVVIRAGVDRFGRASDALTMRWEPRDKEGELAEAILTCGCARWRMDDQGEVLGGYKAAALARPA